MCSWPSVPQPSMALIVGMTIYTEGDILFDVLAPMAEINDQCGERYNVNPSELNLVDTVSESPDKPRGRPVVYVDSREMYLAYTIIPIAHPAYLEFRWSSCTKNIKKFVVRVVDTVVGPRKVRVVKL